MDGRKVGMRHKEPSAAFLKRFAGGRRTHSPGRRPTLACDGTQTRALGHIKVPCALWVTRAGRCPDKYWEFNVGLNKEQVKGMANAVEGKSKEVVGKVVGNKDLQIKGAVQKSLGGVLGKIGDAEQEIKKSKTTA